MFYKAVNENTRLEGIITNREKVGDNIFNHAIYGIYKAEQ